MRRLLRRRAPGDPIVVLEGPRIIREALSAGIEPSLLVTTDSALNSSQVSEILQRVLPDTANSSARGGSKASEVLVVTEQAFRSLAPSVNPQPLLALMDRPQAAIPAVLEPDDLVLVLVGVADPGNTGTIIRTAEACAARCVVVAGGADPWAPKAVRASAGSMLRVPVVQTSATSAKAKSTTGTTSTTGAAAVPASALTQLRSAGAVIVAADAHDGEHYHSGLLAEGRSPVALLLGSEAHGLDAGLLTDHRVRIPLAGDAESLNVAMAATLLAFEYRRNHAA